MIVGINDEETKRAVTLGVYGIQFDWGHSKSVARVALDDVSFEVSSGKFVGLFGPNGSGKSTLMKIIAGVVSLRKQGCSGQVRYLGQDFLSSPSWQRARKIAYVAPDMRAEFPLTAFEIVMLGRTCHSPGTSGVQGTFASGFLGQFSKENVSAVQWAMEKCLCWSFKDRYIDTLSGGEKQLVALACALAQGARVLLLDEALSKMDLNHQAAMGLMLKELTKDGWIILLVSHDMNLALEWVDSAIFLKQGRKLAQGNLAEVLKEDLVRTLYPGVDLMIGKNPITGAPKIFYSGAPVVMGGRS